MVNPNPGIKRRVPPDIGVWHKVLQKYVGLAFKTQQGAEEWMQRMMTHPAYLYSWSDMEIHENVDRSHWSAQPHEVIDPVTGGCQHFRGEPHAVWFVNTHAHEDVKDRLEIQPITGACGRA